MCHSAVFAAGAHRLGAMPAEAASSGVKRVEDWMRKAARVAEV
jgi:hypothetical protein